ncbi:MAG TPA: hypothetical protein VMG39_05765 [Pseudolabrys sp.]|nr:hypothetical protein [Pseudolabrys sp.]
MQELEVTWGRTISIWWLFMWRSLLGALVFGFAIGAAIGFFVAILGLPREIITIASPLLGAVIGILWGVMVMRMALRKLYSDFRIVLVPRV